MVNKCMVALPLVAASYTNVRPASAKASGTVACEPLSHYYEDLVEGILYRY